MPEIKILNLSKKAPEHLQPPPGWKDRDEYVYIGRYNPRAGMGSIFANPYTENDVKKLEPIWTSKAMRRARAIDMYRGWFSQQYHTDETFRKTIHNLIDIARHSNLYLICWCVSDKISEYGCHGRIIKEFILRKLKRFYGDIKND